MNCTDPKRGKVPDEDASDEVVSEFLDHLGECEYHAALYEKNTFPLELAAEVVRSLSTNGTSRLSEQDERTFQDNLERYRQAREVAMPINTISIRVDGEEKSLLRLNLKRQSKMAVKKYRAIEFWRSADREGPEVQLAKLLPSKAAEKVQRASTTLWDGRVLRAETRKGWLGRVVVSVFCAQPDFVAAWSIRQEKIRTLRVVLITALACVLVVAVSIFLLLSKRGVDSGPRLANRNADKSSIAQDENVNRNNRELGTQESSNRLPEVAVSKPPTDRARPEKNPPQLRGGSPAIGVKSLREARTISIDKQEGDFDQQLVASLGKYIEKATHLRIVEEQQRPDARLRLIKLTGDQYLFEVISGENRIFRYRETVKERTPEKAEFIAGRVVKAIEARISESPKR